MTPLRPSRTTIGKSTRERPTARSKSPPGSPKGLIRSGAMRMNSAVRPPRIEEDEPEDGRGDPPGALAVALLEQVAEDRDERAGERRVGEQGADEVRDLERDRERVDLPVDPEVVGRDHLADEAEDPGEARRDREDQRRAGKPPVARRSRRRVRRLRRRDRQHRSCRSSSARTRSPPSHEPRPLASPARRSSRAEALLRSASPASCGHSYARG